MTTTRVCRLNEVPQEGARVVAFGERQVAVFCSAGRYFALDNECPHRAGPLAEGQVKGGVVTCPWHRFRFDLETGASKTNPNLVARAYRVIVEGEHLALDEADLVPRPPVAPT